MKKILFSTNHMTYSDGVAIVLKNLINNLNPEKYDITLIVLFKCDNEFIADLRAGVKIIKVFNQYFKGLSKFLSLLPKRWLYKRIVKDKYDIEVAFQAGMPTKLICNSTNLNSYKIAWMHNLDIKELKYHKNYDEVVCCAKSTAEEFKISYKFPEKVKYLYNIVNTKEIFSVVNEEIDIEKKDIFTFCTVGRLSIEKGFLRLLECHKKLIDNGYIHQLWIVGDGPEKETLENYIKTQKINKTAILVGFNKNPYKYMKNADMFVCSSFREGMSTVCTEALLIGKSVISTEVNGAIELIADNNVGIVTGNDTESLFDGMKKVLCNPNKIIEFERNIKDIKDLQYEDRKRMVTDFFDNQI